MGLTLNRFFNIYVILFFALLVFTLGSTSEACKRTKEAGDAAFRSAVLLYIEKDPGLKGYHVRKITNKINIYTVNLANGAKKKTIKLRAIGEADCKVEVKEI